MPCAECGVPYPICVMQFDHRPGAKKRFNLSYARNGRIPMDVVKREVAKCDVVCANCHLIREDRRKHSVLSF